MNLNKLPAQATSKSTYVTDRPDLSGLHHFVACGTTIWHGYGNHVIARARAAGQPTNAFPTAAQHLLNSRLNTNKLQRQFCQGLPHWQLGVDRMLNETFGN